MSDERSSLGLMLGFLTGAAIGAGLGLLFAPQAGKDTREQVKDVYDKASVNVKDGYDKANDYAQKSYDQIKDTMDKGFEQIKGLLNKEEVVVETKAAPKKKTAKA